MAATLSTKRSDGRESNQIRPPSFEDGLLFRADGSSRLSMGNTVVLAGVFGPASGRSKGGDGGELSIEVTLGISPHLSDCQSANFKNMVADVLRAAVCVGQYPRCTLVVALRVLHADGGSLATLVNAACAAVMDAGVEMHCFPVASSFAWILSSSLVTRAYPAGEVGVLLVDPDGVEESTHTTLTVVCTAAGGQGAESSGGETGVNLLAFQASGAMPPTTVPLCLEAAAAIARSFSEITRRKAEATLR
mmetsp:Transcript_58453/g.117367  ORF Transcript_58453/g.117367 Transcript_58453/m.117367 type:complete len:248 (+) Transcript_58453:158-901(+)|eukprot:CAMPEP_0171744718 /NCGR_PEP_ID=MMETSP0991-20121206/37676_1 /TAXON_ID=483369 /ORGANISM="non described non described, Strain CCMP2098" /LENGTH=247 /DNA_ID=CAMNT_0012343941 /DNA_START=92 /DNA_END=835 /DNA_ORIENTATION=-